MKHSAVFLLTGIIVILLLTLSPVTAAAIGNGTIRVVPPASFPVQWADVSVDGVTAGTIPPSLDIPVPAGMHILTVTSPGLVNWSKRLLIQKGAVVKVVPDLMSLSGSLTIVSNPPGADIYLDGKHAGSTPWNASGIRPGSHLLTLKMAGYRDVTRYIVLRPPKETSIAISLQALPTPIPSPVPSPSPTQRGLGSLVIRTPDDGYGISLRSLFYDPSMPILDGRWHYLVGRTPAYWMNAVPEGKYDVLVTAPGNVSQVAWSGIVGISTGKETVIDTSVSPGSCPWGPPFCL